MSFIQNFLLVAAPKGEAKGFKVVVGEEDLTILAPLCTPENGLMVLHPECLSDAGKAVLAGTLVPQLITSWLEETPVTAAGEMATDGVADWPPTEPDWRRETRAVGPWGGVAPPQQKYGRGALEEYTPKQFPWKRMRRAGFVRPANAPEKVLLEVARRFIETGKIDWSGLVPERRETTVFLTQDGIKYTKRGARRSAEKTKIRRAIRAQDEDALYGYLGRFQVLRQERERKRKLSEDDEDFFKAFRQVCEDEWRRIKKAGAEERAERRTALAAAAEARREEKAKRHAAFMERLRKRVEIRKQRELEVAKRHEEYLERKARREARALAKQEREARRKAYLKEREERRTAWLAREQARAERKAKYEAEKEARRKAWLDRKRAKKAKQEQVWRTKAERRANAPHTRPTPMQRTLAIFMKAICLLAMFSAAFGATTPPGKIDGSAIGSAMQCLWYKQDLYCHNLAVRALPCPITTLGDQEYYHCTGADASAENVVTWEQFVAHTYHSYSWGPYHNRRTDRLNAQVANGDVAGAMKPHSIRMHPIRWKHQHPTTMANAILYGGHWYINLPVNQADGPDDLRCIWQTDVQLWRCPPDFAPDDWLQHVKKHHPDIRVSPVFGYTTTYLRPDALLLGKVINNLVQWTCEHDVEISNRDKHVYEQRWRRLGNSVRPQCVLVHEGWLCDDFTSLAGLGCQKSEHGKAVCDETIDLADYNRLVGRFRSDDCLYVAYGDLHGYATTLIDDVVLHGVRPDRLQRKRRWTLADIAQKTQHITELYDQGKITKYDAKVHLARLAKWHDYLTRQHVQTRSNHLQDGAVSVRCELVKKGSEFGVADEADCSMYGYRMECVQEPDNKGFAYAPEVGRVTDDRGTSCKHSCANRASGVYKCEDGANITIMWCGRIGGISADAIFACDTRPTVARRMRGLNANSLQLWRDVHCRGQACKANSGSEAWAVQYCNGPLAQRGSPSEQRQLSGGLVVHCEKTCFPANQTSDPLFEYNEHGHLPISEPMQIVQAVVSVVVSGGLVLYMHEKFGALPALVVAGFATYLLVGQVRAEDWTMRCQTGGHVYTMYESKRTGGDVVYEIDAPVQIGSCWRVGDQMFVVKNITQAVNYMPGGVYFNEILLQCQQDYACYYWTRGNLCAEAGKHQFHECLTRYEEAGGPCLLPGDTTYTVACDVARHTDGDTGSVTRVFDIGGPVAQLWLDICEESTAKCGRGSIGKDVRIGSTVFVIKDITVVQGVNVAVLGKSHGIWMGAHVKPSFGGLCRVSNPTAYNEITKECLHLNMRFDGKLWKVDYQQHQMSSFWNSSLFSLRGMAGDLAHIEERKDGSAIDLHMDVARAQVAVVVNKPAKVDGTQCLVGNVKVVRVTPGVMHGVKFATVEMSAQPNPNNCLISLWDYDCTVISQSLLWVQAGVSFNVSIICGMTWNTRIEVQLRDKSEYVEVNGVQRDLNWAIARTTESYWYKYERKFNGAAIVKSIGNFGDKIIKAVGGDLLKYVMSFGFITVGAVVFTISPVIGAALILGGVTYMWGLVSAIQAGTIAARDIGLTMRGIEVTISEGVSFVAMTSTQFAKVCEVLLGIICGCVFGLIVGATLIMLIVCAIFGCMGAWLGRNWKRLAINLWRAYKFGEWSDDEPGATMLEYLHEKTGWPKPIQSRIVQQYTALPGRIAGRRAIMPTGERTAASTLRGNIERTVRWRLNADQKVLASATHIEVGNKRGPLNRNVSQGGICYTRQIKLGTKGAVGIIGAAHAINPDVPHCVVGDIIAYQRSASGQWVAPNFIIGSEYYDWPPLTSDWLSCKDAFNKKGKRYIAWVSQRDGAYVVKLEWQRSSSGSTSTSQSSTSEQLVRGWAYGGAAGLSGTTFRFEYNGRTFYHFHTATNEHALSLDNRGSMRALAEKLRTEMPDNDPLPDFDPSMLGTPQSSRRSAVPADSISSASSTHSVESGRMVMCDDERRAALDNERGWRSDMGMPFIHMETQRPKLGNNLVVSVDRSSLVDAADRAIDWRYNATENIIFVRNDQKKTAAQIAKIAAECNHAEAEMLETPVCQLAADSDGGLEIAIMNRSPEVHVICKKGEQSVARVVAKVIQSRYAIRCGGIIMVEWPEEHYVDAMTVLLHEDNYRVEDNETGGVNISKNGIAYHVEASGAPAFGVQIAICNGLRHQAQVVRYEQETGGVETLVVINPARAYTNNRVRERIAAKRLTRRLMTATGSVVCACELNTHGAFNTFRNGRDLVPIRSMDDVAAWATHRDTGNVRYGGCFVYKLSANAFLVANHCVAPSAFENWQKMQVDGDGWLVYRDMTEIEAKAMKDSIRLDSRSKDVRLEGKLVALGQSEIRLYVDADNHVRIDGSNVVPYGYSGYLIRDEAFTHWHRACSAKLGSLTSADFKKELPEGIIWTSGSPDLTARVVGDEVVYTIETPWQDRMIKIESGKVAGGHYVPWFDLTVIDDPDCDVKLTWNDAMDALLQLIYCGQEISFADTNSLCGEVVWRGRCDVTLEDGRMDEVRYALQIKQGWFDTTIEPEFCDGKWRKSPRTDNERVRYFTNVPCQIDICEGAGARQVWYIARGWRDGRRQYSKWTQRRIVGRYATYAAELYARLCGMGIDHERAVDVTEYLVFCGNSGADGGLGPQLRQLILQSRVEGDVEQKERWIIHAGAVMASGAPGNRLPGDQISEWYEAIRHMLPGKLYKCDLAVRLIEKIDPDYVALHTVYTEMGIGLSPQASEKSRSYCERIRAFEDSVPVEWRPICEQACQQGKPIDLGLAADFTSRYPGHGLFDPECAYYMRLGLYSVPVGWAVANCMDRWASCEHCVANGNVLVETVTANAEGTQDQLCVELENQVSDKIADWAGTKDLEFTKSDAEDLCCVYNPQRNEYFYCVCSTTRIKERDGKARTTFIPLYVVRDKNDVPQQAVMWRNFEAKGYSGLWIYNIDKAAYTGVYGVRLFDPKTGVAAIAVEEAQATVEHRRLLKQYAQELAQLDSTDAVTKFPFVHAKTGTGKSTYFVLEFVKAWLAHREHKPAPLGTIYVTQPKQAAVENSFHAIVRLARQDKDKHLLNGVAISMNHGGETLKALKDRTPRVELGSGSHQTRVEVVICTAGWFLASRGTSQSTVICDEIHSLNADNIALYLKLQSYQDLAPRLVIGLTATPNALVRELFTQYKETISTQPFQLVRENLWAEGDPAGEHYELDVPFKGDVDLRETYYIDKGHVMGKVLCFVPTENAAISAAQQWNVKYGAQIPAYDVSAKNWSTQKKVVDQAPEAIVFTTDVLAESITLSGTRTSICLGAMNRKKMVKDIIDHSADRMRLELVAEMRIIPVSKYQEEQELGRAGRTSDGFGLSIANLRYTTEAEELRPHVIEGAFVRLLNTYRTGRTLSCLTGEFSYFSEHEQAPDAVTLRRIAEVYCAISPLSDMRSILAWNVPDDSKRSAVLCRRLNLLAGIRLDNALDMYCNSAISRASFDEIVRLNAPGSVIDKPLSSAHTVSWRDSTKKLELENIWKIVPSQEEADAENNRHGVNVRMSPEKERKVPTAPVRKVPKRERGAAHSKSTSSTGVVSDEEPMPPLPKRTGAKDSLGIAGLLGAIPTSFAISALIHHTWSVEKTARLCMGGYSIRHDQMAMCVRGARQHPLRSESRVMYDAVSQFVMNARGSLYRYYQYLKLRLTLPFMQLSPTDTLEHTMRVKADCDIDFKEWLHSLIAWMTELFRSIEQWVLASGIREWVAANASTLGFGGLGSFLGLTFESIYQHSPLGAMLIVAFGLVTTSRVATALSNVPWFWIVGGSVVGWVIDNIRRDVVSDKTTNGLPFSFESLMGHWHAAGFGATIITSGITIEMWDAIKNGKSLLLRARERKVIDGTVAVPDDTASAAFMVFKSVTFALCEAYTLATKREANPDWRKVLDIVTNGVIGVAAWNNCNTSAVLTASLLGVATAVTVIVMERWGRSEIDRLLDKKISGAAGIVMDSVKKIVDNSEDLIKSAIALGGLIVNPVSVVTVFVASIVNACERLILGETMQAHYRTLGTEVRAYSGVGIVTALPSLFVRIVAMMQPSVYGASVAKWTCINIEDQNRFAEATLGRKAERSFQADFAGMLTAPSLLRFISGVVTTMTAASLGKVLAENTRVWGWCREIGATLHSAIQRLLEWASSMMSKAGDGMHSRISSMAHVAGKQLGDGVFDAVIERLPLGYARRLFARKEPKPAPVKREEVAKEPPTTPEGVKKEDDIDSGCEDGLVWQTSPIAPEAQSSKVLIVIVSRGFPIDKWAARFDRLVWADAEQDVIRLDNEYDSGALVTPDYVHYYQLEVFNLIRKYACRKRLVIMASFPMEAYTEGVMVYEEIYAPAHLKGELRRSEQLSHDLCCAKNNSRKLGRNADDHCDIIDRLRIFSHSDKAVDRLIADRGDVYHDAPLPTGLENLFGLGVSGVAGICKSLFIGPEPASKHTNVVRVDQRLYGAVMDAKERHLIQAYDRAGEAITSLKQERESLEAQMNPIYQQLNQAVYVGFIAPVVIRPIGEKYHSSYAMRPYPDVDDAALISMGERFRGFGRNWEVLKDVQRVLWPAEGTATAVASKGAPKLHLLQELTGMLKGKVNIFIPCSGYSGFESYIMSVFRNENRTIVYNSVFRKDHANPRRWLLEPVKGSLIHGRSRVRCLPLCEAPIGDNDIRNPMVLKRAQTMFSEVKLGKCDLIMFDAGEYADNYVQEATWVLRTRDYIDDGKAYAHSYLDAVMWLRDHVLSEGGTLVVKIMGLVRATELRLRALVTKFHSIQAVRAPTTSFGSREWYLICEGYGRTTPWTNLDGFFQGLRYHLYEHMVVAQELYHRAQQNLDVARLKRPGPLGPIMYDWPIDVFGWREMLTGEQTSGEVASDHSEIPSGHKPYLIMLPNGKQQLIDPRSEHRADMVCERWRRYNKKIRIAPPVGFFRNLLNVGDVGRGKEARMRVTKVDIVDKALNVAFGMRTENSPIGYTQHDYNSTIQSYRKRLDVAPKDPPLQFKDLLRSVRAHVRTPDGDKICGKCGPIFDKERLMELANLKGASGKFDNPNWPNVRAFFDDPDCIALLKAGYGAYLAGEDLPVWFTARNKKESKAVKAIDDDGRRLIPSELIRSELPAGRFREIYKELTDKTFVIPRQIQFADILSRMLDLVMFGEMMEYHTNVNPVYFGKVSGVPLHIQGDVLRSTWDAYKLPDEREITNVRWTPVRIEDDGGLVADRVASACGDFSGWDGTVSRFDLLELEMLFVLDFYPETMWPAIINRYRHFVWGVSITDLGFAYVRAGQRASGDQFTSFGNSLLNAIYHFAATCVVNGWSVTEATQIHGSVSYTFGGKTKRFYLHRMTHILDGDDNVHVGDSADIKRLRDDGPDFMESCGKKIRSETSSGYSYCESFNRVNFCSHYYRRALVGPLSSEIPRQNYLHTTLTRIEEQIVSKGGDVFQHGVHYFPTRSLAITFGKLRTTLKSKLATYDPLDEEGVAMLRGKVLSCLLQYPHIRRIRAVCLPLLAMIGDGRYQVRSTTGRKAIDWAQGMTLSGALKSIYGVTSLDDIQVIGLNDERHWFDAMLWNAKLIGRRCERTICGVIRALQMLRVDHRWQLRGRECLARDSHIYRLWMEAEEAMPRSADIIGHYLDDAGDEPEEQARGLLSLEPGTADDIDRHRVSLVDVASELNVPPVTTGGVDSVVVLVHPDSALNSVFLNMQNVWDANDYWKTTSRCASEYRSSTGLADLASETCEPGVGRQFSQWWVSIKDNTIGRVIIFPNTDCAIWSGLAGRVCGVVGYDNSTDGQQIEQLVAAIQRGLQRKYCKRHELPATTGRKWTSGRQSVVRVVGDHQYWSEIKSIVEHVHYIETTESSAEAQRAAGIILRFGGEPTKLELHQSSKSTKQYCMPLLRREMERLMRS